MKSLLIAIVLITSINAMGKGGEDPNLIKRLAEAQITLMDGVQQIVYDHGPAISAKFEIKNDVLKLSVYTVKKGMAVGAEQNPLLELIGDATQNTWTPQKEEFSDKPHIARASVQLSLLQLSPFTFADVVKLVEKSHMGMIYSVKPKLIKGKALAEVLILLPTKKSLKVMVDLSSGNLTVASCDFRCALYCDKQGGQFCRINERKLCTDVYSQCNS